MGIFNVFFDLLAQVMAFFYSVVPSYGFTIIALTLVVMIILTPLTLKGTRSMMMMQQLQPEMKKLQTQYKDDRQKLNEELMKFYKENNINPVGGCLPLLVQMPVFIVLYNVLRGLTQRVPRLRSGLDRRPDRHRRADLGPAAGRASSPPYLHPDTQLYQSLSQTSVMDFAGHEPGRELLGGPEPGHRPRAPLHRAHRHRGRHRLHPAEQIQGRMTGSPGQPAAADDHEDHADLPAGDLLRAAGRPGPLLRGVQPLPHRPAVVHLPQHLRHQAGREAAPARRPGDGKTGHAQGSQGRARRRQEERHRGQGHQRVDQDQGQGQRLRRRKGDGQAPGRHRRHDHLGGQGERDEGAGQAHPIRQELLGRRTGDLRPTRRRRTPGRRPPRCSRGLARTRRGSQPWSGSRPPVGSIDEAKDLALDQLGVDEQEAEFEILEEPTKGLFGRTRGEARVRARIQPKAPPPKVERRERRRTERQEVRFASESSGGHGVRRPPTPTVATDDEPAAARTRGRGRGRRPSTADAPDRGQPPRPAPADAETPPPPRLEPRRRRPAPSSSSAPRRESSPAPERSDMSTTDVTVHEQADIVADVPRGARRRPSASRAPLEQEQIDEDTIEVKVVGDDLGLLIGPKGNTLVAVQELARTVVQRQASGTHHGRVRIDVGGYRQRRREALERFTQQVAEQVKESGLQKALEPMVASDRKVVHDTANEIDGVRTLSEGEEPRRRVVIAPE